MTEIKSFKYTSLSIPLFEGELNKDNEMINVKKVLSYSNEIANSKCLIAFTSSFSL